MVQANRSAIPIFAAILLAGAVTAPRSASAETTTQHVIFRDDTLVVTSSPLDKSYELFTVDLPKSHKQISVTYPNGSSQDRMWKRLWFSQGAANLTKQEQLEVRKSFNGRLAQGSSFALAQATQADPTQDLAAVESDFTKAKAVVDFLANFLPPNENLEPFDRKVNLPSRFQVQMNPYAFESRYNTICESIGKVTSATYINWEGESFTKDVVVGAIDSECRGRCGAACEQAGQWRHNQYTKECLSHDLCHDETHKQLGPCLEMFWEAAPGYLFAPDCTEKAIAVGPNIPVIIPTPPAGSTEPSTAQPIPDPNPNDGSITTPASEAPPEATPAPKLED